MGVMMLFSFRIVPLPVLRVFWRSQDNALCVDLTLAYRI
jgi:hypothetical protein